MGSSVWKFHEDKLLYREEIAEENYCYDNFLLGRSEEIMESIIACVFSYEKRKGDQQ